MRGVAVLQVLAWLFVVNTSTGLSLNSQTACYQSNVMINCPHFVPNTTYKLVWKFKDKTADKFTDLVMIRNGNRTVFPHISTFDERFTIHRNGSLGVTSLHPDDETKYQCIAYGGVRGRAIHVTHLKVSCGKVTMIKREVCADDDVMLECEAKHRTNPRKLDQVKWHKNTSGNDVSWSLIVASSDSNVTVGDGFKLHGNGSLVLRGGRAEGVTRYKCDVTKNVAGVRPDRHIIMVESVKCRRERRETTGSVKTTAGRVATTTPITVTMETITPSVTSGTSPVHGANIVFMASVVFTWLLMNFLATS